MKKVLIVLLILAVSGGLFALDVTDQFSITGSVDAGVRIDINDRDDDPVAYATDDDGHAVKGAFGFAYKETRWGVEVAAAGNISSEGAAGSWNLDAAKGWMKFFEGMLMVTAGKPGSMFNPGGWVDTGVGGDVGVRLNVLPIPGLDIGVQFSYANHLAGRDIIADFLQETAFGFKFGGDVFYVMAGFELFSESTNAPTADFYGAAETDGKLVAGFGFSGLDFLTIDVDAVVHNLIGDPDVYIKVAENFGFNVLDGLKLNLRLGQILCDGLQQLHIKPSAEFALGSELSVGGDIPIDFNGDFDLMDFGVNVWLKKTIGKAWMKPGVGFTMHGDACPDLYENQDIYLQVLFGYSF